MMTRQRVQEWIAEYGVSRKVKNLIGQQVNGASRTSVCITYSTIFFSPLNPVITLTYPTPQLPVFRYPSNILSKCTIHRSS